MGPVEDRVRPNYIAMVGAAGAGTGLATGMVGTPLTQLMTRQGFLQATGPHMLAHSLAMGTLPLFIDHISQYKQNPLEVLWWSGLASGVTEGVVVAGHQEVREVLQGNSVKRSRAVSRVGYSAVYQAKMLAISELVRRKFLSMEDPPAVATGKDLGSGAVGGAAGHVAGTGIRTLAARQNAFTRMVKTAPRPIVAGALIYGTLRALGGPFPGNKEGIP